MESLSYFVRDKITCSIFYGRVTWLKAPQERPPFIPSLLAYMID